MISIISKIKNQNQLKNYHELFKPDFTPEEMLLKGVFGGQYFRPIYSAIKKEYIEDDYLQFSWSLKINKNLVINHCYDIKINFYRVKAGSTLEQWEKKNWIRAPDYRGWFEWYCKYYQGRRSTDDLRQIKRWININRFKNLALRKKKKGRYLPRLAQTLLHWAIDYQIL